MPKVRAPQPTDIAGIVKLISTDRREHDVRRSYINGPELARMCRAAVMLGNSPFAADTGMGRSLHLAGFRAVAGAWLTWKLMARKILKSLGLPDNLPEVVEPAFRQLACGTRMTSEEGRALVARGGACEELLEVVLTPPMTFHSRTVGPLARLVGLPIPTLYNNREAEKGMLRCDSAFSDHDNGGAALGDTPAEAEYRAVMSAWLSQKYHKFGHPVSIYEREEIVAHAFRELSGGAPMTMDEAAALAGGGGISTELLMLVESQRKGPAKR
jgi:hypothetical protein